MTAALRDTPCGVPRQSIALGCIARRPRDVQWSSTKIRPRLIVLLTKLPKTSSSGSSGRQARRGISVMSVALMRRAMAEHRIASISLQARMVGVWRGCARWGR
jgi:hypothetical protein